MREGRLFQIVYCLLEQGQATATELAGRLEVSVRTIYRDLDALSAAGIPIYAEAGRNGGIRLMHGFVLDRSVLSREEKQEILTALQSLNAAQGGGMDTLRKLSAVFRMDAENWLEVDFSRWGSRGGDSETFALLKTAVLRRRMVRITYANSCGESGERTICPLRLSYRSKAWYVRAYCTKRKDHRCFKLSRILRCELTDETFPPYALPPQPEAPDREYPEVTLRFPGEMAYRVYDEFDPSQVRRQENGDLIVSAPLPEDAWLTGFLLSFGPQVDVLAPDRLRHELACQAKMIYEKNKP